MCLAIPGRVERIEGLKATISYGKEKRIAMVSKEIPTRVGDFVLVQMGCIVQKLSEEEAKESVKALNQP